MNDPGLPDPIPSTGHLESESAAWERIVNDASTLMKSIDAAMLLHQQVCTDECTVCIESAEALASADSAHTSAQTCKLAINSAINARTHEGG